VALLRASREWMFVWWQAATPAFACIGALIVAYRLRGDAPYTVAAAFALTTAWVTLIATWTVFENAFLFEALAILPLFAVVLAAPVRGSERSRELMALTGAAMLAFFVVVRVAKITRAVVTWTGRDPSLITQFVRAHVPPGSQVLGPDQDYFFAVEESGSRYLIASQVSAADWARWMPAIEGRPNPPTRPLVADYILWPDTAPDVGSSPGAPLVCLRATAIAAYRPPAYDIDALAWLARDDPRAAYAPTTLYKLTPTCGGSTRTD